MKITGQEDKRKPSNSVEGGREEARGWEVGGYEERKKKKCGGRLLHGEERERERERKATKLFGCVAFSLSRLFHDGFHRSTMDDTVFSSWKKEPYRRVPPFLSSLAALSLFSPSFPPSFFFLFFLFFFCYLLSGQSWVAILSIVPGHRLENRAHKASIVGHRLVYALICFHSSSLSLFLTICLSVSPFLAGSRKATSWSVDKEGRRRKSWSTVRPRFRVAWRNKAF